MDDPAFEAARRRAEQWHALFADIEALAAAELAAAGIHPVSIAHGDAESAPDAELIYGRLHRLAGECGPLAGYRGGNDYTTFLFTGPTAGDAAVTFIARVLEIAPSWWRITATAHPVWH